MLVVWQRSRIRKALSSERLRDVYTSPTSDPDLVYVCRVYHHLYLRRGDAYRRNERRSYRIRLTTVCADLSDTYCV